MISTQKISHFQILYPHLHRDLTLGFLSWCNKYTMNIWLSAPDFLTYLDQIRYFKFLSCFHLKSASLIFPHHLPIIFSSYFHDFPRFPSHFPRFSHDFPRFSDDFPGFPSIFPAVYPILRSARRPPTSPSWWPPCWRSSPRRSAGKTPWRARPEKRSASGVNPLWNG